MRCGRLLDAFAALFSLHDLALTPCARGVRRAWRRQRCRRHGLSTFGPCTASFDHASREAAHSPAARGHSGHANQLHPRYSSTDALAPRYGLRPKGERAPGRGGCFQISWGLHYVLGLNSAIGFVQFIGLAHAYA